MAAPEHALVKDAEQGVENCRRPLKDFVQESNLCLGKHTKSVCFNCSALEFVQVDRAENFTWLGKSAKQVLEILPTRAASDAPHGFALSRARRTDDEDVFLRHCREGNHFDQRFTLDQPVR